jgi:hypothetical protein
MVDKDVTISQLMVELDLLRSQVLGLEQINAQLRADNQKLPDPIARLNRDSSNSSKPPSRDIVKPKNKGTRRGRRQRKMGGPKGHPRQERIPFAPEDIGPLLPYELSPKQAQGLIPLEEWFVLQQVDLAEKLYVVTEHRARKYLNPRTGRIVLVPFPVAVKAAGLVGPKLSALAAYQKAIVTRRTARSSGSGTRSWGFRSAAPRWLTSSRRPPPPSPSPMRNCARPWCGNRTWGRMNPATKTGAISSGRGVSAPRASPSFPSTPS